MPRKILVTSALPYANGAIHLGHLVEYIQTDIFVRFQKLRGHHAIYLCADDTHGTAIMIRARAENRTEQDLIASMRQSHLNDFQGFQIDFDHYSSTDARMKSITTTDKQVSTTVFIVALPTPSEPPCTLNP